MFGGASSNITTMLVSRKVTEREFPLTYNKLCLILIVKFSRFVPYVLYNFSFQSWATQCTEDVPILWCTHHLHSKYEAGGGGGNQKLGKGIELKKRVWD
jgi:hypothetical protein